MLHVARHIGAENKTIDDIATLSLTSLLHPPATPSHSVNSPLSPSITPSVFHSRLATFFTNLSHHRLPSGLRTDSTAL